MTGDTVSLFGTGKIADVIHYQMTHDGDFEVAAATVDREYITTDHFHGVPFGRPLTRMREYIEIINTLIADEPLKHDGFYFKGMERGFTLRDITLPRRHIPIFLASITPKSRASRPSACARRGPRGARPTTSRSSAR